MRTTIIAATAMLAASAAPAAPITPGLWETTSRMTVVDMPGMPPQALAMMKQPRTVRHCVTPAEAATGPGAAMKSSECKIDKYAMGAGTYDMVMTCKGMRMQGHGTFTATSYSGRSEITGAGPQGQMHMVSEGTGKLVGPCKK